MNNELDNNFIKQKKSAAFTKQVNVSTKVV